MVKEGFIVWLTGLSGAGKSTIAEYLADELEYRGRVEILDGDDVRKMLYPELGYSKEDRDHNVERLGYISRMLARNGVMAIVAAISPYRAARDDVRRLAEDEMIPFIEVHVDCDLETLKRRDTKGLYKRALAGEIKNFTGVNDPYEPPSNFDVYFRTDLNNEATCVKRIIHKLLDRRLI